MELSGFVKVSKQRVRVRDEHITKHRTGRPRNATEIRVYRGANSKHAISIPVEIVKEAGFIAGDKVDLYVYGPLVAIAAGSDLSISNANPGSMRVRAAGIFDNGETLRAQVKTVKPGMIVFDAGQDAMA